MRFTATATRTISNLGTFDTPAYTVADNKISLELQENIDPEMVHLSYINTNKFNSTRLN